MMRTAQVQRKGRLPQKNTKMDAFVTDPNFKDEENLLRFVSSHVCKVKETGGVWAALSLQLGLAARRAAASQATWDPYLAT